ncbi:MAG: DNA polymerase III subunit delta [Qingshengfaniella sp.]
MKLTGRTAAGFFTRPDPACPALLIYGPDAMRVALKRKQVIDAALTSDDQDPADMRLTRLSPADLRGEPGALSDAMRAQGFFDSGGRRVVHLEGALDAQIKAVETALDDWRPGDAFVVITAGNLTKRSKLRKLFETHPKALIAAIYADPPSRAEIEATTAKAGLRNIPGPMMTDLVALAQTLDPGDFAQTMEKLALYKLGDDTPLNASDLAAIAPLSTEAGLDDLTALVAEGQDARLGKTLHRLADQGVAPVAICIALTRHFRLLHGLASDPGGPEQGAGRMRPPLFGPGRDKAVRQASRWGQTRLDEALRLLLDTDLALRSGGQTAPQGALVERAVFRLCFMARR